MKEYDLNNLPSIYAVQLKDQNGKENYAYAIEEGGKLTIFEPEVIEHGVIFQNTAQQLASYLRDNCNSRFRTAKPSTKVIYDGPEKRTLTLNEIDEGRLEIIIQLLDNNN